MGDRVPIAETMGRLSKISASDDVAMGYCVKRFLIAGLARLWSSSSALSSVGPCLSQPACR
jgi:hypothetical protein